MADKLEELIFSDEPLTPAKIRELYQMGLDQIAKASALHNLGISKIDMARRLCKHPNKHGYVCPDCGWDTGPDPY